MTASARSRSHFAPLFLIVFLVSGCGSKVPELAEATSDVSTAKMEREIKAKIYCELGNAIVRASLIRANRDGKSVESLPSDWGVLVTLTLQVDESSTISPGLSWKLPLAARTVNTVDVGRFYSAAFGGSIKSQATRIDKFTSYYSVGDMKKFASSGDTTCKSDRSNNSFLLTSNLKIKEWLVGAVQYKNTIPSTELLDSTSDKQDILSYQIKFIFNTSANATPTFQLTRFSVNPSSPFLSGERNRTHELLITFGPGAPKKAGPASTILSNSHFASEIGQAVGNNLRTNSP